jgi:ABC-type multidrug transport system fused ATPase/permease subunit
MQTFKKFLYLLNPQERKRASLLVLMILIMALLDMVGVASILPFIAVLADPGLVESNTILNKMYYISNMFGVENNQQFLFILGVFVFLVLVTSLIFKIITTYVQVLFVQMLEYSISKRLVEGYLHQPYSWFLNRNSADLGKTILSELSQVIGGGIRPLMELIAKSAIAIAIIILLIIVNPKLALITFFLLGGSYGLIFYFIRNYMVKIGEERLKNNELRFTILSEAFGAAKEVKTGGLEETYIKRFSEYAYKVARSYSSHSAIGELPRYVLEAVAFGGILLIILFLMAQTGNFNNVLPIISLYVFAGYRLMPALQVIYSSFTKITFVGPSLDKLYYDIKSLKAFVPNQDEGILKLEQTISLKNISYEYPNSSRTVLKDININIPAKNTIGLIGSTGSGKTTIIDIILGLLEAQKGNLEVDGKLITKNNCRAWQRSLGYVPQHIYLADDTIAANIAFGLNVDEINQEAVEKSAKIANLFEFVVNELPNKFKTKVGERGVRLSGGQRQRIGIARALYHNPQVLILDEATSALDNETEKAVMEAVNNLSKDITIILIAHRLNTVKNCDIVFKIEKGQLVSQGTFDQLIDNNKDFDSVT